MLRDAGSGRGSTPLPALPQYTPKPGLSLLERLHTLRDTRLETHQRISRAAHAHHRMCYDRELGFCEPAPSAVDEHRADDGSLLENGSGRILKVRVRIGAHLTVHRDVRQRTAVRH